MVAYQDRCHDMDGEWWLKGFSTDLGAWVVVGGGGATGRVGGRNHGKASWRARGSPYRRKEGGSRW